MQEITWKLYSPLRAEFYSMEVFNDDYLMDEVGPLDYDGKALAKYADLLIKTLDMRNKHTPDLAGGIRRKTEPLLYKKVVSIVVSAEVVKDELIGCATVKLREPLDDLGFAALYDFLADEYQNGWGEWRASKHIEVDDGVVSLQFWSEDCFEFDRHLAGVTEQDIGHMKPQKHKQGDAR